MFFDGNISAPPTIFVFSICAPAIVVTAIARPIATIHVARIAVPPWNSVPVASAPVSLIPTGRGWDWISRRSEVKGQRSKVGIRIHHGLATCWRRRRARQHGEARPQPAHPPAQSGDDVSG